VERSRREVIEADLGTVAQARSDDDTTMFGVHVLAPPDRDTGPVLIETMGPT